LNKSSEKKRFRWCEEEKRFPNKIFIFINREIISIFRFDIFLISFILNWRFSWNIWKILLRISIANKMIISNTDNANDTSKLDIPVYFHALTKYVENRFSLRQIQRFKIYWGLICEYRATCIITLYIFLKFDFIFKFVFTFQIRSRIVLILHYFVISNNIIYSCTQFSLVY